MTNTVEFDRLLDMTRAQNYVKAISDSGFTPMGVSRPDYEMGKRSFYIDKVIAFYDNYINRAVEFLKIEADRTLMLIDSGDEDALKDFLDGGRRFGVRTDCNPTIHGDIIVCLRDSEAMKAMLDFNSYLVNVDRFHRMNCELLMYKCGMIS